MEKMIRILNFLFSLAALCISAYAVSGKCCGNIESTVLTIVGICTTLIVGISVVDAFSFHFHMNKMENRMDELTKKQNDLEIKRMDLAKKLEEQKVKEDISDKISYGLALLNWLPYTSFKYFIKGFEKSLLANNVKAINSCLICLESVPKLMKEKEVKITDAAKKKGCPQISEEAKQLEAYKLVKDRFEKIYEMMRGYYQDS